MRVSLEKKIECLADKGVLYKIGKDTISGKYILIIIAGPIEGSAFLSNSISKAIGDLYKSVIEVIPNIHCNDCKKLVETIMYNSKTTPKILCCSECGQFVQQ